MKRIIAIESWNGRNIQPVAGMINLLRFICDNMAGVELSYNFLYTPSELEYILQKTEVKPKSLLYLSFHGRTNAIKAGKFTEFEIELEQLAQFMGKRFKGCGIHFASCKVMDSTEENLLAFMKQTGVRFISGYTKYVDFGESSVLDLALLQRWAWSNYSKPMLEKLYNDYRYSVDTNGFYYYTKP